MDFSKWAVVGFKDDTGIGRMTQDIQNVLGVGHHLVAPSERMQTKPIDPAREFLMSTQMTRPQLQEKMEGLEGIICLERLHWNDHLVPAAKQLGLKTVCVPMWEWFRGTDESWQDADLFICPNRKALEVLRHYGFKNAVQLAWPLDLSQLPQRKIEGPAQTFVHNAGLIDHDDRKGTHCVVKAFSKVHDPGLRLILRAQKKPDLPINDPRIDLRIGNLEDPAELYEEGEVAIQPSRMEGLGFMVLEPVCCGMPVITTAAAPMDEYVRQPELLARPTLFKKKSFAYRAASIRHAYLTPPSITSLAKVIRWCSHNDLGQISLQNRQMAQQLHAPEVLRSTWSQILDN